MKATSEDNVYMAPRRELHGRRVITTNETEITAFNIVKVLNDALDVHAYNREDIRYLYNYLRGAQPICQRVKKVNGEICNKIVVNRANEIVTFKTANFIGEPLQYVSRGSDPSVPKKIEALNAMMMSENKSSKDIELAYWMFTAGVAYRLVLNDKAVRYADGVLFDEAPFEIYTLDPRNTFVVRANDVTRRIVMAVNYVYLSDSDVKYTVYTSDSVFTVEGSPQRAENLTGEEKNNFGMIPIVEYPCNSIRMGAFEIVIDLLDAINTTESNRLDGVEQFIQAIMVFQGVDITREQFLELKDLGAIKLPPDGNGQSAKVYYLNEQLDQTQTQTLVDALYQEVLQIVGMPSQGNANTSDSSNNGAVIMKNGWWSAESRNKESTGMWDSSETEMLKIVLKICRDVDAIDGLKISDIKFKYGRVGYEDKLTKTQSFTTLIGANCPPIQAFTYSNLDPDPESAALAYEAFQKEKDAEQEESLREGVDRARDEALRQSRSNDFTTEQTSVTA